MPKKKELHGTTSIDKTGLFEGLPGLKYVPTHEHGIVLFVKGVRNKPERLITPYEQEP